MIGPRGASVVELNVRFGDTETQVVLPLVEGSLHRLLASAARGALAPEMVRRKDGAAVAVALVDEGYPGELAGTGTIIGLDQIEHGDLSVIHAAGAWKDGAWAVRLHYKPMVRWMWLGAILMGAGGLLTVLDRRYRRQVARVPVRETGVVAHGQ